MSTQEATMTAEQVAERLVELCSMGQFNEAQYEQWVASISCNLFYFNSNTFAS